MILYMEEIRPLLPEAMITKFMDAYIRDDFVYAPSQWETVLHCNAVSQWLGAYTIIPDICITWLISELPCGGHIGISISSGNSLLPV